MAGIVRESECARVPKRKEEEKTLVVPGFKPLLPAWLYPLCYAIAADFRILGTS